MTLAQRKVKAIGPRFKTDGRRNAGESLFTSYSVQPGETDAMRLTKP